MANPGRAGRGFERSARCFCRSLSIQRLSTAVEPAFPNSSALTRALKSRPVSPGASTSWICRSRQSPAGGPSGFERAGPHDCCTQTLPAGCSQQRDSRHKQAGDAVRSLLLFALWNSRSFWKHLTAWRGGALAMASSGRPSHTRGQGLCVGLNLLTSLRQVWRGDGDLRDVEWFGLEGTIKIVWFQTPALGRSGCSEPLPARP